MSITKPPVLDKTFEEKMDMLGVLLANIADNGGSLVVDSPKTLQRIVRLGLAGKALHPSDQIVIERETSMSINSSNSGLTVSVNADTFIEKVGEAHTGVYEFIYDGLVWKLHDSEVELAQYGITVTGTPASGDEIAVHETAASIHLDVLGIDQDTPTDPNLTHTLAVQCHDCIVSLQKDAAEGLVRFPDGMTARTAHIITSHGAYGGSTDEDGAYQFTSTVDIPAGGFLRHTTMGQYQSGGYRPENILAGKFITYDANYNQLEELACTAGSGGTYIGTTAAESPTYREAGFVTVDNLFSTERNRYGNNRWGFAADRQMLQSKAAAGSVWKSAHPSDFPPSWRTTTAGFLKGLDPELVSVMGKVKKTTGLCLWDRTIEGVNYEVTDDLVWLPSFKEVYFGTQTYGSQVNEGGPYRYYSDYSDLSTVGTGEDKNRMKGVNGGAATYWWLRSPHPTNASNACSVGPTGATYYGYDAYISCGLAPAFCIV